MISLTDPTLATRFIFDNEDILLELDGSNNITARYTHGPGIDEPLILEKSGQSFFYHADGLGSITEITDAFGVVKQRYTYSSFGKIESQSDPNFIQPYTFTSREFDPETGLYFYRARYYDPSTGRFLQEDPRGLVADINLFTYVRNNPLNNVDPLGLQSLAERVVGAIGFFGAGAAGIGTGLALGYGATLIAEGLGAAGATGAATLGGTTAFYGAVEGLHVLAGAGLTTLYAGGTAFVGGYTIGLGINYLVPPLGEGRLGSYIYDKVHSESNQIPLPPRRGSPPQLLLCE